jgi:hypothetical protein
MVEMTGEERKVANFLTEKKFKFKFQPIVSVKDLRNKPRLFNPDFYLTELNIYIEVCGTERNEDYERRDKIYKKEEIPIIFVETYKGEDKWKHYLIQRIKEIQEKRQKAVSTITPKQVINDKPKPIIQRENLTPNPHNTNTSYNEEKIYTFTSISKQSQIGIILTLIGLFFVFISIITYSGNISLLFLILIIIGLSLFFIGFYIVVYRFSRWFRDWKDRMKDKFSSWLER